MKTTITTCTCDVCKKEATILDKTIQVIFTTEQTEGRSVKPYLCDKKMDLCEDCMKRRLSGESIFANGAQGYNSYYFK